MTFYQPKFFGLDTFWTTIWMQIFKPLSEAEGIEIVVDPKKPLDNIDNLDEVQQLKAKNLQQQIQIAELTSELEKYRKPSGNSSQV